MSPPDGGDGSADGGDDSVLPYGWKVRALASRRGDALARRMSARREPRQAWAWEQFVHAYAPGRTVLDVGGMFGVDGALSFEAEAAGATAVTCVDIDVTDAFERQHRERASRVRMVVGDVLVDEVVATIDPAEVVFCLGVFYHVPEPVRLVDVLARLCTETLLFEGLTTPEMGRTRQTAVYLPHLPAHQRLWWDADRSGRILGGFGIKRDFDPAVGYANNYWVMSPSCITALLTTAGFRVETVMPSPSGRLRHLFVARRV